MSDYFFVQVEEAAGEAPCGNYLAAKEACLAKVFPEPRTIYLSVCHANSSMTETCVMTVTL